MVFRGLSFFQMFETKQRKPYIAPLANETGLYDLRGPRLTLPQSFRSILPSHSVMTTELHQCPHHGRAPGTDPSIISLETPV